MIGKTTILYALKLGEVVSTAPTVGFNVEEITVSGIRMSVWDIGGQTKLRQLWRHYYEGETGQKLFDDCLPNIYFYVHYVGAIAVIFVVDANDRERMTEARAELETMSEDPSLKNLHLLILANKQDLPNAASVAEVTELLSVANLKNNKSWHVQGCCAVNKEGIQEGFEW